MPRSAIIVLLALAIAGCGEARQASTTRAGDPEGAAAVLARTYARALLGNRDGDPPPPTAREIDALAKRIHTTCKLASGERYACRLRIAGFGTYGCALVVTAGHARNLRCGGGSAPIVRRRFVDCTTVGAARGASAPAGDAPSAADLTAVSVSAAPGALCADFTLATPPAPQMKLTFQAFRRAPAGVSSEALFATVDLFARGGPEVTTENHGSISADVGMRGREVSLLIRPTALTPALRYLFTDAF